MRILPNGVNWMWNNLFESRSGQLMERAMDVTSLRSQLISHNIANVNTPNYKRLDVDFAAAMQDAVSNGQMPGGQLSLAATHARHLQASPGFVSAPMIVAENGTSSRMDGNNVDVEYEMGQVAQNALFFQSLTTSWNREMSRIKMVIEGRS